MLFSLTLLLLLRDVLLSPCTFTVYTLLKAFLSDPDASAQGCPPLSLHVYSLSLLTFVADFSVLSSLKLCHYVLKLSFFLHV